MRSEKMKNDLPCVLPWKAFFMNQYNGVLKVLPCCSDWIKLDYGEINEQSTVDMLWNGPGAQEIRHLIGTGQMEKICAPECHWLHSGRFRESNLKFINGPLAFEQNQELNNLEISHREVILESHPMALRIIPTLLCNNHCRMCYQDHKITMEIPKIFYNDCFRLFPYLYDYQLHGGEVLISKAFPDWVHVEIFHSNPQLRLSLITNGTEIPAGVKEILKRIRINYITVSINAASKIVYQLVAGFDRFDKVINNVIFLRDLGRSHSLLNFPVYISFVVMKSNYHELVDFIMLANKLGLPYRLLLIEGNRCEESFFNDPFIVQEIIPLINEAECISNPDSIEEVRRIRFALNLKLNNENRR